MLSDKGELEDYALSLIQGDIDNPDDAEAIAALVADRISSGMDFEFPVDSDELDGQILSLADSLADSENRDGEGDDGLDDPFADEDEEDDDGLDFGDDSEDEDDDMGDGDDDLF